MAKECKVEECRQEVEGKKRFCTDCRVKRRRAHDNEVSKAMGREMRGMGHLDHEQKNARIKKAKELFEKSYALPWNDRSGYF